MCFDFLTLLFVILEQATLEILVYDVASTYIDRYILLFIF